MYLQQISEHEFESIRRRKLLISLPFRDEILSVLPQLPGSPPIARVLIQSTRFAVYKVSSSYPLHLIRSGQVDESLRPLPWTSAEQWGHDSTDEPIDRAGSFQQRRTDQARVQGVNGYAVVVKARSQFSHVVDVHQFGLTVRKVAAVTLLTLQIGEVESDEFVRER